MAFGRWLATKGHPARVLQEEIPRINALINQTLRSTSTSQANTAARPHC